MVFDFVYATIFFKLDCANLIVKKISRPNLLCFQVCTYTNIVLWCNFLFLVCGMLNIEEGQVGFEWEP